MSTTSLLLLGSLVGVVQAPPPPPDPDEMIVEDDAEPPDPEEATVPSPDDGAASEGAADAPTTATAPAKPGDPEPGSIPTEGPSKPPPSSEALAREGPFAEPATKRRFGKSRTGSPQRFALEFKLGPYLPDIDRDYDGPGFGPYATIFGRTDATGATVDEPKPIVMPVIGFEWQFLYLAGPLGLGTQIGFMRDKAKALITVPLDPDDLRSDADDTTFGMVPLSLLLTYRFELLADRFRVPLVPFAKAGLAYSFFWNKSGSGHLARSSDGSVARGGVPGWQLNLGGMLRLDFIEPGTAKKLDQLSGINHTYVFGEYQLSRIDNFGVGQVLNLGDSTWFAGLAVEF